MAERITIVGAKPDKVKILDRPQRRIEPAELAAALGAKSCGERVPGNLDPIALAELGTQLLQRLRSSGGRPALADATEYCRVPLSAEDVKALQRLVSEVRASTGTKPSLGQMAGIIVHNYLAEVEAGGRPK